MGLSCSVGGARGTFEPSRAAEVARLIDRAFGPDGDWDGTQHRDFGTIDPDAWVALGSRAGRELGGDEVPNLLLLATAANSGPGVYLPGHINPVELTSSPFGSLRCASLTGLRSELFTLADRWGLPVDDDALAARLDQDATTPEDQAFARITLAANEAMRLDCPLWLVKG
jgi:hypothetical protein